MQICIYKYIYVCVSVYIYTDLKHTLKRHRFKKTNAECKKVEEGREVRSGEMEGKGGGAEHHPTCTAGDCRDHRTKAQSSTTMGT